MRLSAFTLVLTIVNLSLSAASAAQVARPKPADAAAIDELAQQIFAEADTNRNHVLNKSEFQKARAMLDAGLMQWAQEGRIGQSRKPKAKDKEASATPAGDKPKAVRNTKVGPAEFTFYVHAAVEEADARVRAMKAAAEAQRKALQAQRRAAQARYRGWPLPGHP